ncbi:hypothetical protein FN846DRAFT_962949 [Sphaerosporella brunnea]|uniref:Uncharacterized protein n=1 Tax=Sphaerosporella brunnea TaxID=1250544 RepID=A0A5J5EP35_9PEZI|nr:hypothetical protein FN846DRAFT_962949 [Sphaerosporella brunnea]
MSPAPSIYERLRNEIEPLRREKLSCSDRLSLERAEVQQPRELPEVASASRTGRRCLLGFQLQDLEGSKVRSKTREKDAMLYAKGDDDEHPEEAHQDYARAQLLHTIRYPPNEPSMPAQEIWTGMKERYRRERRGEPGRVATTREPTSERSTPSKIS